MSRRAAGPWKLLEFTLLPTHSGVCGFTLSKSVPLTPRAEWHELQVSSVWQLRQRAGSALASIA